MPSTIPAYEALANDIKSLGVECAFGLMSDDTARFVTTLDAIGVQFHGARHENNAAAMAEGYAAATGKVGVAVIGRGPAAANALHGATYARRTGSRVLLIFGEVAQVAPTARSLGPDLKAFDTLGALKAAGIRTFLPTSGAHARQLLQDAIAATMLEGAVALLLPTDVQGEALDSEHTKPLARPSPVPVPVPPRKGALQLAAELVAKSRRPLIVAGRGAVLAGAREDLLALADHLGAALATTLKARGFFNGHPLDCGVVGSFSHSGGRRVMEQADCVLVFGAALNQHTTSHGQALPAGVPLIQVDRSADAIGRWCPVDLAVVGDVRLTAQALLGAMPRRSDDDAPFRSPTLQRQLAEFDMASEFVAAHTPRTVDPRALAVELDRLLPRERNTVYDAGNFLQVVPYMRVQGPGHFKMTTDFSSIGMGFGTALGFARGTRDRPTVLFIGDGSFLMTLSELETVAREDIALVIVVMNDCAYGAELHYLKQIDMPVSMSVFPDVDFAPVASAFGFQTATVRTMEELRALAPLLAKPEGPILIDCKINSAIAAPFMSGKK